MTKVEIEPQKTKKIVGEGDFDTNATINGVDVGLFIVRGEGARFSIAKRERYAQDGVHTYPSTTSLKVGLEEDNDDALYVKNLSPTDTLTVYYEPKGFIIDSLNVGGQSTNDTETAQVNEEKINADGSVIQRIELDLTEVSRDTVEAFVDHDSAVNVKIEGSNDPDTYWHTVDTASSVSEWSNGYNNGFRYVAIEVSAGNSGDNVNLGIMGAR